MRAPGKKQRPCAIPTAFIDPTTAPWALDMGSETSKVGLPTGAEAKAVVIPRIPQEIVDEILDRLATDFDFRSLQSCALVSKSWIPSCRRHLFHTVLFTSKDRARWLETFPVPEESPAHFVRDLHFSGVHDSAPERLVEHAPWFTNVERVTLSGLGAVQRPWLRLFRRLPRSVTSLSISAESTTLPRIRDVILQLPNLDDLSLSGSIVVADWRVIPGMGTILRGRFGGQLRLLKGLADDDIVNMLLEIPTGLYFSEVQICGTYERLLPTVRLTEACGKALVKLSYTVSFHCKSHLFSRPDW